MFQVGDVVRVKPGVKFNIIEYDNLGGAPLRVTGIENQEKFPVRCHPVNGQTLIGEDYAFQMDEIIPNKPLELEDLM